MFLILLSWIYIALLFCSMGIALTGIIENVQRRIKWIEASPDEPIAFSLLLSMGMAFTTLISAILSLFIPLSYGANILLLFFAILVLFSNRPKLSSYYRHYK